MDFIFMFSDVCVLPQKQTAFPSHYELYLRRGAGFGRTQGSVKSVKLSSIININRLIIEAMDSGHWTR